jgi:hypothetical protein
METAGLESIILNQTDSQFAYIHRRDIMSIMHIINDYTNQISKYVDVEYGQVRLRQARLRQATYEVILSMEKFNYDHVLLSV